MPYMELISLFGGAMGGFLLKFWAISAANKQAQFEMFIKTIQAKDDSMDRASKRAPGEAGKWVRRVIVLTILFGVILAPFILALIGKPVIVEVQAPVKEWFLGLWSTGGYTKFYELNSYILMPELRQALLALIGYYFGMSAAKA